MDQCVTRKSYELRTNRSPSKYPDWTSSPIFFSSLVNPCNSAPRSTANTISKPIPHTEISYPLMPTPRIIDGISTPLSANRRSCLTLYSYKRSSSTSDKSSSILSAIVLAKERSLKKTNGSLIISSALALNHSINTLESQLTPNKTHSQPATVLTFRTTFENHSPPAAGIILRTLSTGENSKINLFTSYPSANVCIPLLPQHQSLSDSVKHRKGD